MASPDTKEVSDATFKAEVIDSAVPVLVYFHAVRRCGPCKANAMAPALEAVATAMKGKIKVAKIDVDQNPQMRVEFRHSGDADAADSQGWQGRRQAGWRAGAEAEARSLD